ncbi:MAG TPA: cyclic nucleotide-binding domain-containing protein [Thermoanaerobaculia bacterium]|nr:cyclic nucleotide-binding domain-containing protein [Thermoanaerobaculia bacterium]
MTHQESLRRWESFSHFSDQQLAQLGAGLSRVRIPGDAAILRQGEPTLDAYLVESGRVRIQRSTPYGLFTLAVLGPGAILGETAFVDRRPRTSDAITAEDTELLVFSPGSLDPLLQSDAAIAAGLYWLFWKSLSAKLRKASDNLGGLFLNSRIPSPAATGSQPVSGFRVGLDDKRRLFEEQKLSRLEINFLSSLSQERKYEPGQVIFGEGEDADEMFVVLEGRVRISKEIPGAGEEALSFLERGAYFGEMALIDSKTRSADARAHDEGAVVLAFSREVLEGILGMQRLASTRLLSILCTVVSGRLRELDKKLIGWFILAGGQGSWPVEDV